MKKLLIVIIVLVIMSGLVSAKLSDETLKDVETLRAKHYPFGEFKDITDKANYVRRFNEDKGEIEWVPFVSFTILFEDGKLLVKTKDGTWFIEMKKVIE